MAEWGMHIISIYVQICGKITDTKPLPCIKVTFFLTIALLLNALKCGGSIFPVHRLSV